MFKYLKENAASVIKVGSTLISFAVAGVLALGGSTVEAVGILTAAFAGGLPKGK